MKLALVVCTRNRADQLAVMLGRLAQINHGRTWDRIRTFAHRSRVCRFPSSGELAHWFIPTLLEPLGGSSGQW
jgi:hypothetical protein